MTFRRRRPISQVVVQHNNLVGIWIHDATDGGVVMLFKVH